MYNPNYHQIENYGWICSRCGRSYSPNVSMCPYCGGNSKTYYSTTTATPSWIYKPDEPTSGWFNDYLKFTQADSSGNIDNSKTVAWNCIDVNPLDSFMKHFRGLDE